MLSLLGVVSFAIHNHALHMIAHDCTRFTGFLVKNVARSFVVWTLISRALLPGFPLATSIPDA